MPPRGGNTFYIHVEPIMMYVHVFNIIIYVLYTCTCIHVQFKTLPGGLVIYKLNRLTLNIFATFKYGKLFPLFFSDQILKHTTITKIL